MRVSTLIGSCLLILAVVFSPFVAASSDKPQNLLCSVIETVDCPIGEKCWRGRAKDLNFPQFVHIDLDKKVMQGKLYNGEQRTAQIERIVQMDGKIILQGFEKRAWNLTLHEETGEFTASATDEKNILGVFGACMAKE